MGSGYMGVLALCYDFDGPPHVQEISFGCCHCTEHSESIDPAHRQIDTQHEHCTDVEISFSFIGRSSIFEIPYDYLPLEHPLPVMNRLDDRFTGIGPLCFDRPGPPISPPRQAFASLSTTVIIC